MASLISQVTKLELQSVFTDIHDTFARDIKAYKEGRQVTLSSNSSYSHIYNRPVSADTVITTLEKTISARIYYYPRYQNKDVMPTSTEESLKLSQAAAEVRIKVPQVDYDFLKDAERIILDGATFSIASTAMPHGLFGSGFYTFILKRTS